MGYPPQGGGVSAADIWGYATRGLTDPYQPYGLTPTIPHNNSTAKSTTATSATKLKETQITFQAMAMNTSFDLRSSNSAGTAYGQIYINGTATGTLRSTTSTTYVTYTETITRSWTFNDLYQIYGYISSSSYYSYVQNQQITGVTPRAALIDNA
jgi:hypothetical protein